VEDKTIPRRDLPSLELQCFGAPTARLDGRPAPQIAGWRKHLALLIYLAISPDRTRTRSHLQGLLWPEKSDLHARHSLNQAVKLLRDQLGVQRLISQGESLTLLDTALTVDALQFQELAEKQPSEAVRLLRGGFLEGFVLDDAPGFEEWATNERTRFRLRSAAALVAAGEQALAGFRYAEAMELARRTLSLEPYSEPAVRLLMRAAALSGDIAGSLAAFKEFATRLTAQIGEQPSRDLKDLAERVRTLRWRRFAPIQTEEEPPLVGREAIHQQAFALVETAVREGPRTLLITGDPGTGRTRFLVECAERLTLAGAVMAGARPLESDQDSPWSTLRALLRAGLLKAPGSAAADPGAYALLSALGTAAPADAAEVAAAFASLLGAVAEEQPVGVVVDDAHFSDGPSLAAIGGALSELHNTPVVLLLTSLHSWEHTPRELRQLRALVGRNLPGCALRLEQFSEVETRELVHKSSSWCQSDADRDRLARRLFFETGGNPFLVVTLLRGLADAAPLRKQVLKWPPPGGTSESQWPISVPSLARRAIMARVADLDEESSRILQAACIGSPAIDIDLIAALTGKPCALVEDKLTLLERRRFVTFDGERYTIAAPVLADVVRGESLLPGDLRTLRNRAIAVLESRTDLGATLLRAQLLAATLPGPAAFDQALAVAQTALAEGSIRTARQALAAAVRCFSTNDEIRGRALDKLRAQLPSDR
jgi:DNA-binding SARP family transcriptional activator